MKEKHGGGIALLLKPIPALAATDCAHLNARNCSVIQMIAALPACLVDCTFGGVSRFVYSLGDYGF